MRRSSSSLKWTLYGPVLNSRNFQADPTLFSRGGGIRVSGWTLSSTLATLDNTSLLLESLTNCLTSLTECNKWSMAAELLILLDGAILRCGYSTVSLKNF